jgi:hypothetical protein
MMEKNPEFTMTESLANGLKNRFFFEMSEDTKTFGTFRIAPQDIPKKRSQFKSFVEKAKSSYSDFQIINYEGGSSRKPYIAFELLSIDPKREFNTWNEKCVYGSSVIFNLNPFIPHSFYSTYNIGEHAISRVFLRSKSIVKDNLIEVKSLFEEVKFVPLWAAFWGILFFTSDSKLFIGNSYPIIPSPNGLFLATIDCESKRIEIRTFLGLKSLSDAQLHVRESLLEIGRIFQISPLSFWGPISQLNIDRPAVIMKLISHILQEHKSIEKIKDLLFSRVTELPLRLELKRLFDLEISFHAQSVNNILLLDLEQKGMRKFMMGFA